MWWSGSKGRQVVGWRLAKRFRGFSAPPRVTEIVSRAANDWQRSGEGARAGQHGDAGRRKDAVMGARGAEFGRWRRTSASSGGVCALVNPKIDILVLRDYHQETGGRPAQRDHCLTSRQGTPDRRAGTHCRRAPSPVSTSATRSPLASHPSGMTALARFADRQKSALPFQPPLRLTRSPRRGRRRRASSYFLTG